jgi:hypothetical protein
VCSCSVASVLLTDLDYRFLFEVNRIAEKLLRTYFGA